MAYLCPTSIDNISAIDSKIIITPVARLNSNPAILNKTILTPSPRINNIIALFTRTVREPAGVYNLPGSSSSSKTVFMPIMPAVASSSNRPLTGQFWPRNIIIRS